MNTNWNQIETKLKMSTIEKAFAAECIARGQQPRMTHNEVRTYLAVTFGNVRTKSELAQAIESSF